MKLFETMRLEAGQISRLQYHYKRIKSASQSLNIPFDFERWQHNLKHVQNQYPSGLYRVKLIVHQSGEMQVEVGALGEIKKMTSQLMPSKNQVPTWQRIYKTSERDYLAHDHTTQLALFHDADGKILEFDIGNVVVVINGQSITPNYAHDFLQGCMRQMLLEQHKIIEQYFTVDDLLEMLQQGGQLWMINSLREWVPISLELKN